MQKTNFITSAAIRGAMLATIALSMAIRAQGGETPLKVFVLAGQSNMEGMAASADLPADMAQPQKDVLLYQAGAWVPLAPGKNFGPEIAFGRTMTAAQPGQQIGIIKVAVGGTNLAVKWSPDDIKSLYGKLVKQVKEAQKGRTIVIAGMLWMQGEADSKNEAMAGAYKANFLHLIESARRDFGNASLPFVFGRVNPPPCCLCLCGPGAQGTGEHRTTRLSHAGLRRPFQAQRPSSLRRQGPIGAGQAFCNRNHRAIETGQRPEKIIPIHTHKSHEYF